jgi:hypothetical protein
LFRSLQRNLSITERTFQINSHKHLRHLIVFSPLSPKSQKKSRNLSFLESILYNNNKGRHSGESPAPHGVQGESRNPGFPVKTGIQSIRWFPTFVGTTSGCPRIKYGAGSSGPA